MVVVAAAVGGHVHVIVAHCAWLDLALSIDFSIGFLAPLLFDESIILEHIFNRLAFDAERVHYMYEAPHHECKALVIDIGCDEALKDVEFLK